MAEIFGSDCYSPREIAERVETVGAAKANLSLLSMSALGVLAGGFIGLGAMFATIALSDAALSFAVARSLAGVVFSLGLILVVVAGAELFTGNNLLVMACVAGRISVGKLLANFAIIYFANLIGAAGLAALVALSSYGGMSGGERARCAAGEVEVEAFQLRLGSGRWVARNASRRGGLAVGLRAQGEGCERREDEEQQGFFHGEKEAGFIQTHAARAAKLAHAG